MAQLSLNARWTFTLDNREMRLVTLGLAGRLSDELAGEAKELLRTMTEQRLNEMTTQVDLLRSHLPPDDGAD
jgi:hypothetical protein